MRPTAQRMGWPSTFSQVKKINEENPKPAAPTRSAAKPSTPAGRMSDDAVKRATGHDWDTWFGQLDRAGAAKLDHKSIATPVGEKYGAAPW